MSQETSHILHLFMKKDCLFCLSCGDHSNHNASCHILGTVGKPVMSKGAPNCFHNVLIYDGIILNKISQKNHLNQY